jgi:hypothetical protein
MRRRYLDGPSMNCGYDQHPNTAKWNLQRERGGRPRSAAVAGPCCCCQGASSMEAVGEAPAWTRRRWRRNGIEAGMEEESARGGGGVGRSWMGRPLASGTQTSRRRLGEEEELSITKEEPIDHDNRMRRRSRVYARGQAVEEERAARVPVLELEQGRRTHRRWLTGGGTQGRRRGVGKFGSLPASKSNPPG